MSSPSDVTCRNLLSSSAELRAGVQTVELEEAPCEHRNGTWPGACANVSSADPQSPARRHLETVPHQELDASVSKQELKRLSKALATEAAARAPSSRPARLQSGAAVDGGKRTP
jgi:hypothetical protein